MQFAFVRQGMDLNGIRQTSEVRGFIKIRVSLHTECDISRQQECNMRYTSFTECNSGTNQNFAHFELLIRLTSTVTTRNNQQQNTTKVTILKAITKY